MSDKNEAWKQVEHSKLKKPAACMMQISGNAFKNELELREKEKQCNREEEEDPQ